MPARQPPLLSDLLAHHSFLEQLALRLTGDPEEADDLIQDTFLVAIERPPRHDANLEAWLQRVLRRIFYRRRRREWLARAVIEAAPALPAAAAPAAEAAARADILRLVAEQVLALEEPLRNLLVMRFYDGLTPRQIAAQLRRPVNTVVSQIRRGLERLGRRMDKLHDGERSRWIPALVLVAPHGSSRAVPPRTERGAMPPFRARKLSPAAWFALACLVIAPVVIAFLARETLELRAAARDTEVAHAAPGATTSRAAEPSSPGERREAVVPVPPHASGAPADTAPWLDVEAVDERGAPIPDALVQITRARNGGIALLRPEENVTFSDAGQTDADGRLRVVPGEENRTAWPRGVTPPGAGLCVGLSVQKPGFSQAPVHYLLCPVEGGKRVRVQLAGPAWKLHGRVADDEGRPLKALVVVNPQRLRTVQSDGVWVAEGPSGKQTAADGRYAFPLLPPSSFLVFVHASGFLPRSTWIDGLQGLDIERDFVLHRGASLRGVVYSEDWTPVPGALVRIEYQATSPQPVLEETRAGADGAFEISGIHAGPVFVQARDASATSYDSAFLDMSPAGAEWHPELRAVAPMRLRILTEERKPLAGCAVRVTRSNPSDNWNWMAFADAGGAVALVGLAEMDEPLELDVYRTGQDFAAGALPCHVETGVMVRSGERVILVPRQRLEHGTLVGRLVPAPDDLRIESQVHLRATGSSRFHATRVDALEGTFHNERLPCQRYEATILCDGLGTVPLGEFEIVPGVTHDLGDIRLPRVAEITIEQRWSGPAPHDYELVALQELAGCEVPREWLVLAGSLPVPASLRILPGRYRWSVLRAGVLVEQRVIDVQPGAPPPR